MTPLALRRAEVAQAVAAHLVTADFRRYISAHPHTRDEDGEPVIVALGPDESVDAVITATAPHDHSVMLATILDEHVFVCVLGAAARPGDTVPKTATPIDTDASTTVADLARRLLPLAEGEEFAVTYQAAPQEQPRVLVGSK